MDDMAPMDDMDSGDAAGHSRDQPFPPVPAGRQVGGGLCFMGWHAHLFLGPTRVLAPAAELGRAAR